MQVILAGSFAFDIVDRLSGGTLNITVPKWVDDILVDKSLRFLSSGWAKYHMTFLVSTALLFMAYLGKLANGALTLRMKLDLPISVQKLESYLSMKSLEVTDSVSEPHGDIKKCSWKETDKVLWRGEAPKIEVLYNETYGFLLSATLQVNRRRNLLTDEELVKCFKETMESAGIIRRRKKKKKKKKKKTTTTNKMLARS